MCSDWSTGPVLDFGWLGMVRYWPMAGNTTETLQKLFEEILGTPQEQMARYLKEQEEQHELFMKWFGPESGPMQVNSRGYKIPLSLTEPEQCKECDMAYPHRHVHVTWYPKPFAFTSEGKDK